MNADVLKDRTRRFGIEVTRYVESQRMTSFVVNVRNQLIRSATSVGANYREACRSRSRKEFINKIDVVLQELEETRYWLELLADYGCTNSDVLQRLTSESTELNAIMTASSRTAKRFYKRTHWRGNSNYQSINYQFRPPFTKPPPQNTVALPYIPGSVQVR